LKAVFCLESLRSDSSRKDNIIIYLLTAIGLSPGGSTIEEIRLVYAQKEVNKTNDIRKAKEK
jgi:uncharacterized membrane protein